MSIPKLYTVHSFTEDDTSSIDPLTNFKSDVTSGSDDESYSILSYFPKKLQYSHLNNFVANKYVLFVSNHKEDAYYSTEWFCGIFDSEGSVKSRFTVDATASSLGFEYVVGFKDLSAPSTLDWELTLRIECHVKKNWESDRILVLEHTIKPIEADLLSANGASFEDETGLDNSAVLLGNEPTTHFVRGHLGEYLVAKKKLENGDGDPELNNAGAFVHQTAAIAYNNVLNGISNLRPNGSGSTGNQFDLTFSNQSLQQTFITGGDFNIHAYRGIGICSLHLHHVLPIILETEGNRVRSNNEIFDELRAKFNTNKEAYITAYHRCVFPKSAISLSVNIFDRLFKSFQEDASGTNLIYKTNKITLADKKAKIAEWKTLNYSELRETSNDRFMKNLLAEYYAGHFHEVESWMVSYAHPRKVLKIDWSQFIQKILNPAAITIPFTLIKVQVNDLRSGKPIKNALVKRIEFHSFISSPSDGSDIKFSYEVTYTKKSDIEFKPEDSTNRRVQKICKILGYYTSKIDDGYAGGMRRAIHAYMTSTDRLLAVPDDIPTEGVDDYIDSKKDVWCDYIIADFEANCITDDDGILNCRVPDELMKDRKLNINISFSEFAIVQETSLEKDESFVADRPIKRPPSLDGTPTTYFLAHWVGDPTTDKGKANPNHQNLDWDLNLSGTKNFGWKITESYGMEPALAESKTNQLRLAIPLEVKKIDTEEYPFLRSYFTSGFLDSVDTEDYEHFSTFYEETGIHFVLYGMQWCQPVWDEYDDTEAVDGNPKHSYLQDSQTKHPHMHLVTLMPQLQGKFGKYPGAHEERWEEYGGKGYGKYEANNAPNSVWRGGNSHRGYDIHAKIGANVFALHNGIVSYTRSRGDGGDYAELDWVKHDASRKDEYGKITYCHLEGVHGFLRPEGEFVLAGTLIAKGGRSGNIGTNSFNPSHVHLTVGNAGEKYYPQLRKSLDKYFPENKNVLPSNFSPLLFPCRGETPLAEWDAKNCQLDNARSVQYCWAAAELRCPYIDKQMEKSNETTYQLQAQLRYLNEKPATVQVNDLDPRYKIVSEASGLHPKHQEDLSAFLAVDANPNYYHPYHRNLFYPATFLGELGDEITKIENSSLAAGTKLTRVRNAVINRKNVSNANYTLKEVKYEESPGVEKTTWIESTFIGAGSTITELIENLPAVKPSRTQMAIYAFRSHHGLLKKEDYYLNFTTDDEFWTALHAECGF